MCILSSVPPPIRVSLHVLRWTFYVAFARNPLSFYVVFARNHWAFYVAFARMFFRYKIDQMYTCEFGRLRLVILSV